MSPDTVQVVLLLAPAAGVQDWPPLAGLVRSFAVTVTEPGNSDGLARLHETVACWLAGTTSVIVGGLGG